MKIFVIPNADASAINTNQVKVTFNTAVADTTKAAFAVKKGAANYFSSVSWNDSKTEATVTTSIKLPAGDYSVEVTGLTDTALSKTVTFLAEEVSSIVINESTIELKANAPITYKVLNQYGADMSVTSGITALAYNVTQAKAHALTATASKSEYTFAATFATAAAPELAKENDVIRVSLSYNGKTVQKELTVVGAKAADQVTLGTVQPLTGKTKIFQGDVGLVLPTTVVDQYGNAVKLAATTANLDGVAKSETVSGVTFTSSDATIVDIDKLTVDADGVVKFPVEAKAGTVTITAIVNKTGAISTTTITAEKTATVATFTIAPPTTVVAGGDVLTVNYSAADQYGAAITTKLTAHTADSTVAADLETLSLGGASLDFTSSDPTILDVDKITVDAKGVLKLTTEAKAGSVTLTIKNGTETVGTLTLDVQAKATASKISAVSSTNSIDTNLVQDKIVSVKAGNFDILDQYGRKYTLTGTEGLVAWMSDGSETYVDLGDETDYTKNGADNANANAALIKIDNTAYANVKGGAATGTEKIKFALTSDVADAKANLITGSEFEVSFANVAKPTTYTVATDKTEYTADQDIAVTITAKKADGSVYTDYNQSGYAKVQLDAITYNRAVTFVNGVATVSVPATTVNADYDVHVIYDGATYEIGAPGDGDIKVTNGALAGIKLAKGTTLLQDIVITAVDADGNTVSSYEGTKLVHVTAVTSKTDETAVALDKLDADGNIVITFTTGESANTTINSTDLTAGNVITITVDGLKKTLTE